jgi:hypothetical protein
MSDSPRQQSNPFSTGSGGANFETRVQAAFTVLMLTGRVAPCLPPWPITKLKLQGSYAGFKTDDFIVYTRDPQSQNEAKLLAQIKHDLSITETDETFAKVIEAAWRDFNDASVFDVTRDALALVTGPLSALDIGNVRPLLEWARHSEDEEEFLKKVHTAQFSSAVKQTKLKAFRTQLTKANGGSDISDKQLWEFLKSFHLLGYDLDTESGTTTSLIQSLIAQYANEDPFSLWSRIVDAVQMANQNAGTVTLETFPQDIRGSFNTKGSLPWDSDLKKLRQHGEYILDGIRLTIGGVHVKRQGLLAQLLEVSESSKFVFLSGGRGCGKSSLVREFFDYVKDQTPAFCLRTEDLDKAHLDNVFSSMGLASSIGDIEAGFALMPRRYLLVESIEKLLELEHSAAFTDLLEFLKKHPGWTVIATGRDYAYQQIVFNYLQPSGVEHSSLIVNTFDDDEVGYLCEKLEQLKAIADNPTLRPLLNNPFFADLAYRVAEAGAQFSNADGEKEFRAAVWRDVIAKEHIRVNGMPLKRTQLFVGIAVARAKQMVYGVPTTGFDPEALLRLEEDNLIRRDISTGLVSPAHDVLEDWALERFIEDAYRQSSGDVIGFLEVVGHEPAMNRAYRLWLHQRLKYSDNVRNLILSILKNPTIQRYWQDETIAAVLLDPEPYGFLNELLSQLLEDDGELLIRFCFILRISCKVPNQDLIRQLSATNKAAELLGTLYLMPYGQGWNAVIRFLLENKERIPRSFMPHVVAVLNEWASVINIQRPLPAIAREAGLLALWLLKMLKDAYRDDDGTRRKVLSIIIKTAPVIQNEFTELLDTDVFQTGDDRHRPPYVRDFCKLALMGIEKAVLCKYIPDTVTKLALHEWLLDESAKEEYQGRGIPAIAEGEYFGLQEYRSDFFPPSGAKGPFHLLLEFHPRKGLDFILQLLNHTVDKYVHFGSDPRHRYYISSIEPREINADEIEIPLSDGTSVTQYNWGNIWMAYRGNSNVPYLLESALMALENWLIGLAEEPGTDKILEWLFAYILRNSNSVMPTAVLASVATGFPDKLGKAALPLLRTPVFYDLDMTRTVHESGEKETNWFLTGFQHDPLAELYAEERRIAALRPWRRRHLEDLITHLQFSLLKEEALAVIDELRAQGIEGDAWRFRFHRIDSRGWEAVEDREHNRILFKPQQLEPDLEEIQQRTQDQTALMTRFFQMSSWAEKTFKKETLDRTYYSSWAEALTETKSLRELLESGLAGNIGKMYSGGVVKAAAVFLRDHSEELSDEDYLWCTELVLQAALSNADSQDITTKADKTDFDGAATAASVLPILLNVTEDDDTLFVKEAIALALTHANANVRAGVANGVREYLWEKDPAFAQQCIVGCIEYARLETESREEERRRRYQLLLDEQEDTYQSSWVPDFRKRLANGDVSLSGKIEELGFQSHSPWHLVNACAMVPNGSTEPTHVALLSRMLALFFETEQSVRKQRSDRIQNDIHIHYELGTSFSRSFAEYFLALYETGSPLFIEQLLEGCDTAPEFIEYLRVTIAYLAERTQKKELFWQLWNQLSEKLQAIAIELAQYDDEDGRRDQRRKLIRGMLEADVPWQKVDYESQDIALGKEPILTFVSNAGKNPDVFEALCSLMYHFPKIFFNPGIHILAKHQMEAGGTQLLSGVNTAFYLEGAVQRFLQIDEIGPLPREMHESCFVLLNALVETASSRAYYLREQLIRSRRIS